MIYPVADEIPPNVSQRLLTYTEGGTQVAALEYPQMGETLVFLVP